MQMSGPDLTGKVAIVTGSTKGIGRAIAEALAAAGCSVVVSGRDPAACDAAAVELGEAAGSSREDASGGREHDAAPGAGRPASGEVVGKACDVRDPDACAGLVAGAVERFGRLDILVNNAGLGIFRPISELTVEEFQLQVETNLNGVFYLSKAALPHLSATGDGWIINIGSLASRNSFAGGTGYNASKFGLLGLTEATMLDVRHDDVRVSIIMPGSVNTGFWMREQQPERSWRLEGEDCARAVLQLLSYPKEAHVSRIEMRPSRPPKG